MEKMMPTTPTAKPLASETPITIGIDVSKDHLDAARYSSGDTTRVANTRKGHTVLLRWIGKNQVTRVVFEATGSYHKGLEQRLDVAGLAVAKVNPRQARRFAESTGKLAKTDRVDALMLARFSALLEPTARPIRSETQNQLAELVAARRNLMRDRTAMLNRVQILSIELLSKRHARHRLRQIEAQVASLDVAIEAVLANDPVLIRRRNILLSIPGLGYVTAQALLADMPELGTMDEAQATSLAGLAPVTRQSGKWQGKSFIRGGRACLRQALYMPALVAMRFNPDLKRVYRRLVDNGKHAKLAITAVMRKLVILANALLRDDRVWTPKAA